MKTQEEIVARIEELSASKTQDFLGFQTSDLLEFLEFENAKPFLIDDATEEKWAEVQKPHTREAVIKEIKDYMPFAWGKANDCRGLSAARSLEHMKAWFWLLGEEIDVDSHTHYGKPQLVAICERPEIDVDWRELDDGCWRNSELDAGVSAEEVLGR